MTARAFRRLFLTYLVILLLIPASIFAQEPPPLTQHYSTPTDVGNFSFNYPDAWIIDDELEPGAVWMASNPAMLSNNDYLPDEVVVAIVLPDSIDVLGLEIPPEDLSASTIVDAFAATTAMADHLGPIQSGDVGGHQAVWLNLLVENEEGMILAVELGDFVSVVIAASLPDNFEPYRSTVFEIVASITLESDAKNGDEATARDNVVFEQHYTNAVSDLTFQYPETWLIQDDQAPGVTFVASSQDILDTGDPIPGGALLIILTEEAFSNSFGDELGTNATEIVKNTVESFLLPVDENVPVKTLMIGDHHAARMSFASNTAEGVVIVIDLGDRYGIIIAATSLGEFSDFEATILGIAETVQLGQEIIALAETFSSANFAFTFDYPAGWNIDDSEAPIIVAIGNVRDANSEALSAGDGLIFVYDPLEAGLPSDLTLLDMAQRWQDLISEGGEAQVGDIQEMTIANRDAAQIAVVTDDYDSVVLVIEVADGQYAVLVATAVQGEFDEFEATILAVAASVQPTPIP
jgi:hypothetical protein